MKNNSKAIANTKDAYKTKGNKKNPFKIIAPIIKGLLQKHTFKFNRKKSDY